MVGKTLKLTNEEVDRRLINRNIERLENYTNSRIKMNWKCLICNNIWLTNSKSVLNDETGCPHCSGLLLLTNEEVDRRLICKNIIRLDNYTNIKTKMNWQCKICDYIWITRPDQILNSGHGCPNCAGLIRLTNDIIDKRLINRNVIRLDDYKNSYTKMKWECVICFNIWTATSSSVVRLKTDCPKCYGNIKLSNEEVDRRLVGRNIIRLGNYINSRSKMSWKCTIDTCNSCWIALPRSVLNDETGCPNCSIGKNEKIVKTTLEKYDIKFEWRKDIRNITDEQRYIRIDFYFHTIKLILEYNGDQHYRPVMFGGSSKEQATDRFENYQKPRDQYLKNFCIQNNIQLIEIDGRKYKNSRLEKYLINELIPYINNLQAV